MTNKPRGRRAKIIDPLTRPEHGYCRKCQKTLPNRLFYTATDLLLDTSGLMSVCKTCVEEIFSARLQIDLRIEDAVLYVCRALNIYYDPECIESAKKEMKTYKDRGTVENPAAFFGRYKARLGSTKNVPPHFIEPSTYAIHEEAFSDTDDEETKEYLIRFWGSGMTLEQYDFLESELARWKRTHKCDNTAEETLIREICFTQLEIREARQTGKSPDGAVRRLQELMKTASLDPAKANAINSGKASDTFGQWVKEIEELTPAEWYDRQEKFRDIDGIGQYFEDYVVRPLRNFVTSSRDFTVGDVEVESGDDEEDFEDTSELASEEV